MNNDHTDFIIKYMIISSPIEVWNKAIEAAIETVREVLREEDSSLTYEVASELQQRLHQQMINIQ